MPLFNSANRYGIFSRLLHWTIAILILGLVALGGWMTELGYYDRWQPTAIFWHRALGILALALAAIKIAWRFADPPPPSLAELKNWERFAAGATHRLLIAMMLLIPASGYLISTSAGATVPFFGGMEIPAMMKVGDSARDFAVLAHYWLGYGIAGLAGIHAAAALKHHFIDKNSVLKRML